MRVVSVGKFKPARASRHITGGGGSPQEPNTPLWMEPESKPALSSKALPASVTSAKGGEPSLFLQNRQLSGRGVSEKRKRGGSPELRPLNIPGGCSALRPSATIPNTCPASPKRDQAFLLLETWPLGHPTGRSHRTPKHRCVETTSWVGSPEHGGCPHPSPR